MRQLGEIAQALVTDPLTGSASGYSLVGHSPGLSRAAAQSLVQQPLVTDYLHLLPAPEKRSFFAFYPLPDGDWALTRRFLHGRRRGAFNRVVVHALILPPALLDQLDDPPLTLRAYAALGEGQEAWMRLGDRLVEENVFGGAPLALPELALAVPADLAERRIAGILDQREHLLASWGEPRLRASLARAFAALAHGRLLLDQGLEEEQLLGLLFSLLPWRDRRRAAFTTHLPVEALGLFRLAALEAPQQTLERLPPGHGSFSLHAELPRSASGADALAGLFFEKELLERWLREERGSGASLWDDGAGLAAQIAFLASGGEKVLEGFAGWPELRRYLDQVSLALRRQPGQGAWQDPAVVLGAVAATLLRRLGDEAPEAALLIAIDGLDLLQLVEVVLSPANLRLFFASDPGGLGEPGRAAAIGLALAAGRPAPAELEVFRQHFPQGRLAAGWRPLWDLVSSRLAKAQAEQHAAAAAALGAAALGAAAPGERPPVVLERLLGSPAAASPERFARELLGELSGDPARRLAEGLDLLRSPGLSQRAKWLLEDPFLGWLLDGAGESLLRGRPRFAEIEASFGLAAQQTLAAALGKAGTLFPAPASEFLNEVLRAGRMDLAGVFLRAAGPEYFRGLGAHRGLIGQLKEAWAKPAHRLDLLPWGAAIGRLEEVDDRGQ